MTCFDLERVVPLLSLSFRIFQRSLFPVRIWRKDMAEAAGCHVNQKASQQNQAQIQDDLRPSADPRSGVSQNYLRRRLPGADVKHVNVAFCVQKEIQKLRNCGQQKEERRRMEKTPKAGKPFPASCA